MTTRKLVENYQQAVMKSENKTPGGVRSSDAKSESEYQLVQTLPSDLMERRQEKLRELLAGKKKRYRAAFSLSSIPKRGIKGAGKGHMGLHISTYLYSAQRLSVNSAAVKYLQLFSAGSSLTWATLVNGASEFSTWQGLFDEIFIHFIELEFKANNKNSSNSTSSTAAAGSPGDLNTCGATVVFVPFAAAAIADSSTAWILAREEEQHKLVNLADDWTFKAFNPQEFDWNAPLSDQASTTTTMGWLANSLVSTKLGGLFQIATPYSSGAAVGLGTLLENGVFGDLGVKICASYRVRF